METSLNLFLRERGDANLDNQPNRATGAPAGGFAATNLSFRCFEVCQKFVTKLSIVGNCKKPAWRKSSGFPEFKQHLFNYHLR
jgi:hypothetical protein